MVPSCCPRFTSRAHAGVAGSSSVPVDIAHKAVVLRCLQALCEDGQLLVDLFVNYDCDLEGANLFERMVPALVRIAQGSLAHDPGSAQSVMEEQAIRYEVGAGRVGCGDVVAAGGAALGGVSAACVWMGGGDGSWEAHSSMWGICWGSARQYAATCSAVPVLLINLHPVTQLRPWSCRRCGAWWPCSSPWRSGMTAPSARRRRPLPVLCQAPPTSLWSLEAAARWRRR